MSAPETLHALGVGTTAAEAIDRVCCEDIAQAEPVTERASAVDGVAPYARDPQSAARLWTSSENLVRHSPGLHA